VGLNAEERRESGLTIRIETITRKKKKPSNVYISYGPDCLPEMDG
jgi:hypothetical protein